MKKYITAAVLFAAGTVLSNAAADAAATTTTLSTNVQTGATASSVNSFGFSMTLGSDWLTGWSDDYTGLTLSSVSMTAASGVTWNTNAGKLAVAEITDGSAKYIGLSGVVTRPTSAGATITFTNFTDFYGKAVTLSAGTLYAFLVTGDGARLTSTGSVTDGGDFYPTQMAAYANSSVGTETITEGFVARSGTRPNLVYNYAYQGNNYKARVSVSGTAIPEPSAFGLIAGVGALALVAARRRRRAK